MAMWNPWRGCHRCSEGSRYCYIHKGDLKRGVDTEQIVRTKGFDAPVQVKRDDAYTDGATYYGTAPWLNDPNNPESEKWRHSFKTTSFFENGYNIRLAWSNPPSLCETTRQVIAEQEYTVPFIEETKAYADDPKVLEATRLCILERRQEEAEADGGLPGEVFLLTDPAVVDVNGPYEDTDQQQVLES